jgi:hypothetical protein
VEREGRGDGESGEGGEERRRGEWRRRRRGEWRGRGGDDQPVGRTMVTGSAGRQWRPGTNATGRWHERGGNPSFSRVHALCSRALARACALAPAEPGSPDAPIFHAWREPGSEPPFASGGTGRESEQPTKRSGVASGGPGCLRCTQPIRPLIAPLDWRDECRRAHHACVPFMVSNAFWTRRSHPS